MDTLKTCNHVDVRRNRGDFRLLGKTTCVVCDKPLNDVERYAVRTVRTARMTAPAFYYYCMDCTSSE